MSGSESTSRMTSCVGGRLRAIVGLSAARVYGTCPARGDLGEGASCRLVSVVGALRCVEREGEDAGTVGRGAAGVCAASLGLSACDGMGGRDGDDAVIAGGEGIEVGIERIGGSIAARGDCAVGRGTGIDVSGGVGVAGSGAVGGADAREVKVGIECSVGGGMGIEGGGVWIGLGIGVDTWLVCSSVGCRGTVGAMEGIEDSSEGGATAATVLGVGGGSCVCAVSGVDDGGETSSKCVVGRGVGLGMESVVTGGFSPSRSSFRSSRV